MNPYYLACPTIVQNAMDKFAKLVGRQYHLFDYVGAPDAEHVIIIMGSGAEAVHETVDYLTAQGEKVGVLKVRLLRPFSVEHFLQALPKTVKSIAVLDRTKEPGSIGEPLYQDVVTALTEGFTAGKAPMAAFPKVIGGRYGLSSKEFTPAMVNAHLRRADEADAAEPLHHRHQRRRHPHQPGLRSRVLDRDAGHGARHVLRPGRGRHGGRQQEHHQDHRRRDRPNVQGYFVYDSKKSGAVTTSHLRFSKKPIHSTYLISRANFVACHQFSFMERLDVLKAADPGAVFLLNSPFGPDEVWDNLPRTAQKDHHRRRS